MCVCLCAYMRTFSHPDVSDSLQPHGLYPFRLLCPWNFPGKTTGADCHFLLQGIFLIQGSNLSLAYLHWQVDSSRLCHLETCVCVCVCICIHTNMCNNMVVSQKYAECKEPHAKRIQTVWFNLYEVVEKYASLYSDRKDIGGFLGQRSEIKGRMEDGGMWRNFSEDKTCYILIEVVGIRVCLYVKNQQTEPLK